MNQPMKDWEKQLEWTFKDHRNEDSLGYMIPTIGDLRKLKDFFVG